MRIVGKGKGVRCGTKRRIQFCEMFAPKTLGLITRLFPSWTADKAAFATL